MRRAHAREPILPQEWQDAVNGAQLLLHVDAMQQYGLLTGGPRCLVDRCRETIRRGRYRGIHPQRDIVDAALLELTRLPEVEVTKEIAQEARRRPPVDVDGIPLQAGDEVVLVNVGDNTGARARQHGQSAAPRCRLHHSAAVRARRAAAQGQGDAARRAGADHTGQAPELRGTKLVMTRQPECALEVPQPSTAAHFKGIRLTDARELPDEEGGETDSGYLLPESMQLPPPVKLEDLHLDPANTRPAKRRGREPHVAVHVEPDAPPETVAALGRLVVAAGAQLQRETGKAAPKLVMHEQQFDYLNETAAEHGLPPLTRDEVTIYRPPADRAGLDPEMRVWAFNPHAHQHRETQTVSGAITRRLCRLRDVPTGWTWEAAEDD